jgi:hypothetical protein
LYYSNAADSIYVATTPSGTWRCMSYLQAVAGRQTGVWCRIS